MLWDICLIMQRCVALFYVAFKSVKLCYFACLTHLIDLIKSLKGNSEAGEGLMWMPGRENKKEYKSRLKEREKLRKGKKEENVRVLPPCYRASHGVRREEI